MKEILNEGHLTEYSMKVLKKWFQFFRLGNVIIMLLTFYLIRYCVSKPYANQYNINLIFNEFNFILLVCVTALTAMAGYVVNNIYDAELDKINKPTQSFIESLITRSNAWKLFFGLNLAATFLIFRVYFSIDWFLIWMYPFGFFLTWGMLWLYSFRYKKSVLKGNLIVGLFVSFVPWSVCYPELVDMALGKIPWDGMFFYAGILYIVFAFVSTILREIIKDCEDIEGDAQFGCRTLPVVYGIAYTNRFAQVVSTVLLLLLIFASVLLFKLKLIWSLAYSMVFIVLPLLIIFSKLKGSTTKKDFHNLSQICKVLMLTGLLFLLVV